MHQARASGHENVTVKVTGKWVKNVVCGLYVHGGICGASARRGRTPKLLGIALFNFRKAPDIHLAVLMKLVFLEYLPLELDFYCSSVSYLRLVEKWKVQCLSFCLATPRTCHFAMSSFVGNVLQIRL